MKRFIAIAILALFLVFLTVLYLFNQFDLKTPKNPQPSDFQEEDQSQNNYFHSEDNSINQDSESIESETSQTSASGGDSQSSYINSEGLTCTLQKIPYILSNIEKKEVCTEFQNDTCTNKIIYCEIPLTNAHPSVSGDFTIEISFINSQSRVTLKKTPITLYVSSGLQQSFASGYSISGADIPDIFCSSKVLQTPTLESCS